MFCGNESPGAGPTAGQGAHERRFAMNTFCISRRRLILGSVLALSLTGLARAGDLIGRGWAT